MHRTIKTNIMNNKELIEELKLDIQYLQAVLSNGWYNGQKEKNERSAELEYLIGKFIRFSK